jgi:hypothetical protein
MSSLGVRLAPNCSEATARTNPAVAQTRQIPRTPTRTPKWNQATTRHKHYLGTSSRPMLPQTGSIFLPVSPRSSMNGPFSTPRFARKYHGRRICSDAALLQRKLQEQQQAALESLVNDDLIRIETEGVEQQVSKERLDPQVTDHRPAALKSLPELRAKTFVRYSGGVAAKSVSSQKRVLKIQVKHVGPSSVGDALIRSRLGVKEGDPITQAGVDHDIRACMARGTSTTYG